ncbi:MAG: STAS domain-containing protein [Ginsengibacter sp.]
MKVKIDTKEKFHVITPEDAILSANMTEDLKQKLLPFLTTEIKNVVLKLGEVVEVDNDAAESILNLQQEFYDNNASFVICEMQKPVEEYFDKLEMLEVLNVTPTESEAWDIVQMEEIEREFLD